MTERAKDYASALFSLAAEEGTREQYGAELALIGEVIDAEPSYLDLLASHALPLSERFALAEQALGRALGGDTLALIRLLIERGEISLLPEVIGEWQALCREADRVIKATVSSAEVLTDLQKTQLEEKLSRRLGGRIEAEYRVDPSLLGGIRVETDDSVLDGSLIGRLSVWKDVMKQ